ncbi:unnamed protein product [Rangifer tarandus platyrhynchus]|uniref:Uncharacterized protein n=1 Tax=Rangifer tarandus platyrhynchus TaxID=3082113 RepID=A0ABN9A4T8_RANTA|nr:unnamed protein product [Rangifer tarandus platyrhynchus]
MVKNLPANAGDPGLISGSGRSNEEGNGNSLPCSYLENPHGHWSLVGYSPWGRKDLDTNVYLFSTRGKLPKILKDNKKMRPQSKHYFNYRLKYSASDEANIILYQSLKI